MVCSGLHGNSLYIRIILCKIFFFQLRRNIQARYMYQELHVSRTITLGTKYSGHQSFPLFHNFRCDVTKITLTIIKSILFYHKEESIVQNVKLHSWTETITICPYFGLGKLYLFFCINLITCLTYIHSHTRSS